MNEPFHPAQIDAIEKLKPLRVGALYAERPSGKYPTIAELVRHRLHRGRIHGAIWLCAKRQASSVLAGIARHAPDIQEQILIQNIEMLSHNREKFMALMRFAERSPRMLVIDNSLLIKNSLALRTQRVLALSQICPYRLLICDVPFSRSYGDLFTQWYALDWRILGYRSYWGFCVNHQSESGAIRNAEYLARKIHPYCAQILRKDERQSGRHREFVWRFSLPAEAREEYCRVANRFLRSAAYSGCGVYRMLQACQHVTCGRRILKDFPLITEPLYRAYGENPRMNALLEVLNEFPDQRILILCRYRHEYDALYSALCARFGSEQVEQYPGQGGASAARLVIMNIFSDQRQERKLHVNVIIHYSSYWDWRKRQEKELQCHDAGSGEPLTIVSLAAADTLDMKILRCLWKKDNLIQEMRRELAKLINKAEQ